MNRKKIRGEKDVGKEAPHFIWCEQVLQLYLLFSEIHWNLGIKSPIM